jgi:Mg-chelatase subunit ChlD
MQKVHNHITATTQVKGGTDIAMGMNMASRHVFTPQGGDRSDVPNMMLVLTDGGDSSDVIGAHRAAAAKNITVAVIGIGNGILKLRCIRSFSSVIIK